MAALNQNITPPAVIQLFSGIPRGSNNIYPRARVSFTDRTAVTLKAAANTKTVNYLFNLPGNYAYRMDSSFVSFNLGTSTEVQQYEVLGGAALSLNAGVTIHNRMTLESVALISDGSVAGGLRDWRLLNPYGEVFESSDLTTCRLTYTLFDNDNVNETVAQDAQVYVSFLQYDITQILDVSVNAPQPVSVV